MVDLKLDRTAWPVLAGIVDTAKEVFAEFGLPERRVSVQHGPQSVLDITDGCDPVLWVRLVNQFPSSQFPNQDVTAPNLGRGNPVPVTDLATQIEVGAAHCSVQWEVGEASYIPSEEDYAGDTELSLAEMTAMRVAICRYLSTTKRRYVLNAYAPFAQGGVIGGTWVVTVEANRRVNGA